MEIQKITIVGDAADVRTTIENCSPFDVVMLCMEALEGLVEAGILPPPIVRAGLDALSVQLSNPPLGE